jgi:hypothetical protein
VTPINSADDALIMLTSAPVCTCKYLPEDDKQYMTKVRQSQCGDVTESDPGSDSDDIDHVTGDNVAPNKLRVVSAL